MTTRRPIVDVAGTLKELPAGDVLGGADVSGTWTPSFVTSSGSITLSAAIGTYVKVGRLVHVFARMAASSVSSPAGLLEIEGLPFTIGAYVSGSIAVTGALGSSIGTSMLMVSGSPGDTRLRIANLTGGDWGAMASVFLATSSINLSLTYPIQV